MTPNRDGANVLLRSDLLHDVGSSLQLLNPRSRRRLLLLVAANMSTSLLDLVGVALVGALSVMLVTFIQPTDTADATGFPMNLIARLGIPNTPIGLFYLGLAAGLFLLLKSILGAYLSRRTLLFLARRQAEVAQTLSIRLFRQPLSLIEKRTSQETIYALLNGVNAAIVGLLGAGALALAELALLIVLGIALLILNFWVTVAAAVFFSLLALFMHLVLGSWASRTGALLGKTNYGLMQSIQEASSSFREITVSGRMDAHTSRMGTPISVWSRTQAVTQYISQVPKYVYETSLLIGALALGAFEFSRQSPQEAVVTVSVFLAAGSRIMPSMLRLQNCLVAIRSSAGQAEPTYSLYRSLEVPRADTPDPSRVESADPSVPLVPTVTLRAVSARYPDTDTPALEDIDLDLSEGSTLAVVGPTGAGKSTLADVILGILPIEHGEVTIGGRPPLEAIAVWPGSISYVPQHVSLISGSVRENVAIGIPPEQIDDDLVWESLASVQLEDFLRSEREGLDTEVGERGVRLSGGQRQRLGLARALYSQPRLLVLDEATSALDAETEAAIARTLADLHGRVTTIVIAHRLTTIRHADLVVYIDGGHILARGDFESVRNQVTRFDESARILGL